MSHTPDVISLHPIQINTTTSFPTTPELLGAHLAEVARQHLSDLRDGVLVVDATAVGERIPARQRVVEVMRRAQSVVAEWMGDNGVTRLVTVGGDATTRATPLLDAGARHLPSTDEVGFPPDDPGDVASRLFSSLVDNGVSLHAVVLAVRTADAPVALASAPQETTSARLASVLDLTDADAVLVRGARLRDGGDVPVVASHVTSARALQGTYESARSLFGVTAGTPTAIEVGLPRTDSADDIEDRIGRACRLALLPVPEVQQWHPVRKHVHSTIDLTSVDTAILQIGVRVDAPDDLTLGVAVGRLVLALAVEGVQATPVQHVWEGNRSTALVAFLGDDDILGDNEGHPHTLRP